jgi:hypothetical protein
MHYIEKPKSHIVAINAEAEMEASYAIDPGATITTVATAISQSDAQGLSGVTQGEPYICSTATLYVFGN